MKRRIAAVFTVAALVLTSVSMSFALGEGNARKGKFLYRKNCRSCHGASASDLSPMSKTQAEWKATFEKTGDISCNSKWPADMTPEDVNDIFTYLHDFAKDSPTPAKCS
ncbi:cytochrome c family protein [hydrocarbon metagenome]|uniref:Cytochrome c family protein n=1 Tax=hydrocarbon metagenome TaxID=938273 RepID=A0A0W8G7W8_9ZZZZ